VRHYIQSIRSGKKTKGDSFTLGKKYQNDEKSSKVDPKRISHYLRENVR